MDIKFLMENYKKGTYQLKEINKLNKSNVYIGKTINGQDDLVAVTYVETISSYKGIHNYHVCIVGQLEEGLYLKNPIKVVHVEDVSFYDNITTNELEEIQHKITIALQRKSDIE